MEKAEKIVYDKNAWWGFVRGRAWEERGGVLCPAMNSGLGEMPQHAARLCYNVHRALNFA